MLVVKKPLYVRLATQLVQSWERRVSGERPPQPDPATPTSDSRLSSLWSIYKAAGPASATTWSSLIQVVIFSIAAAGAIASGVVIALTAPSTLRDTALARWLYLLLSNGWGVVVILCGTYYLLTFGAMLRAGRHSKKIECLLLEADPGLDASWLFEHSVSVSRRSTALGYVASAVVVFVAALGPQFFFHFWWAERVDMPICARVFEFIFMGIQSIWLIGYGVYVVKVNRPVRCNHALTRASS